MRKYGEVPYRVAVIHGGPGAPGEMAPVARELASECGILEPLQTADTLEGQVEELRAILEKYVDLPVTLVGYSWGAWLGYIIGARYPLLVRKLILISSGPFDAGYAVDIMKTRFDRLTEIERMELSALLGKLHDATTGDKDTTLAQVGEMISRVDSYDPMPHDDGVLETQYRIFQSVWNAAEVLRASGRLLQLATEIRCPVTAIHGDYDPHPAEGVRKPLSNMLSDFRFILIKNCGHTPWIEKQARDEFFRVLKEELNT
ncbi:alpha/beta hydrolase [bacterium SM23_57]|nr:MAG: alpha/beta hydrolase [bacterium SM23_57]